MSLPVPVDTARFPFRPRDNAERLLHTVGTGTGEDRNGTKAVLDAMRYVKSPVRLTLRSQVPLSWKLGRNIDPLVGSVGDPADLYGDEGAFVMPRRFGGLCLPMLEALSVGMPVFGNSRSPETSLLSPDWLMPVRKTGVLMTRAPIGLWEPNPEDLASLFDYAYERPDKVAQWSEAARVISSKNAWTNLWSTYNDLFSRLVS